MHWRRVALMTLPAIWTFVPLLLVEQAADYYYLAHDPAVFFTISGWRLPLFIIIALVSSVAAGALLRDLTASALSEFAGIFSSFLTFYSLCDPRVCFSTGEDGLEPLRLGFFLATIAVAGGALGMAARGASPSRKNLPLISFCAFAAVAWFPVVFTLAGTRILGDLHPWAILSVLALAAFGVSAGLSARAGKTEGLLIPPVALVCLLLLASGIALAYIASLTTVVASMACTTVLASAVGVALNSKRGQAAPAQRLVVTAYALGVALVLATMLVAVPDAVSAVVPQAPSQTSFSMGAPVYTGAYMYAPPGHASGAGVTVDFGESSAAAIQADNFLSAGIGIHSAGCCVDGIDYSYRFDAYLFHNGNESLAASAWEVCDDNAACGGHSWKSLIFLHTGQLNGSVAGKNVTLMVAWVNASSGLVAWNYSVANGRQVQFASFNSPPAENRNFNTGLLEGGTLGPQQSGSYFFQFGIMSGRPIGRGGWTVELSCPKVLTSDWNCVQHARTLQGDQSFWKVFWRWGEGYPDVSVSAIGSRSILFEYSASSPPSFQSLW